MVKQHPCVVFVTQGFNDNLAFPESADIIGGWVKAAAAEIHDDRILGDSLWIEHHSEWMANDSLLPDDVGYGAVAVRMYAALAEAPTSPAH